MTKTQTSHSDIARDLDTATLRWGWRVCRSDRTSRGGYTWPQPGQWAVADAPTEHDDPCPRHDGDGLCAALTWDGAASGGLPVGTVLLLAWAPNDEIARDSDKARLRRAWVAAEVPVSALAGPGAYLAGAYLYGANLAGARMRGAYLRRADLRGADLADADLAGADLAGAYLNGADLRRADLRRADLLQADLRRADLTGADLTGAVLAGADLTDALYDAATVWPDGVDPVQRGAVMG